MTMYRFLIAFVFSVAATMAFTQLLATEKSAGNSEQSAGGEEAIADASAAVETTVDSEAAVDSETTPQTVVEAVERAEEQTGAPSPEVVAALQAGPRALSLAFRMAAKQATSSVVVIYTYGQTPEGQPEPEQPRGNNNGGLPLLKKQPETAPKLETMPDKPTGLGSGVIVSDDGLIITNNHVIRGATRVVVQLPDETRVDADVIRGDPDSDVAIVRINTDEILKPITIGDSDKLEIGDWVLAIGSPFRLEATVSAGIISGKNRRLERVKRSSMLQTDAAINPGNSGGALIDLNGNMIGISTAIATRSGFYQGVGFAIPINMARWIASELDDHGKVRRAAIGATLAELKPRIARKFNFQPYSGILVYQIIKGSVADQAGMQPLDVIVEFAGEPVRDSNSLQEAIERKPIGSKQPVVVRRDGERVELEVELATVDDPTGDADKGN